MRIARFATLALVADFPEPCRPWPLIRSRGPRRQAPIKRSANSSSCPTSCRGSVSSTSIPGPCRPARSWPTTARVASSARSTCCLSRISRTRTSASTISPPLVVRSTTSTSSSTPGIQVSRSPMRMLSCGTLPRPKKPAWRRSDAIAQTRHTGRRGSPRRSSHLRLASAYAPANRWRSGCWATPTARRCRLIQSVCASSPGRVIRWINLDPGDSHTTTAYHPNETGATLAHARRRRTLELGRPPAERRDFSVTLTREGVYDFFCIPHEQAGMVGRIIVARPRI